MSFMLFPRLPLNRNTSSCHGPRAEHCTPHTPCLKSEFSPEHRNPNPKCNEQQCGQPRIRPGRVLTREDSGNMPQAPHNAADEQRRGDAHPKILPHQRTHQQPSGRKLKARDRSSGLAFGGPMAHISHVPIDGGLPAVPKGSTIWAILHCLHC